MSGPRFSIIPGAAVEDHRLSDFDLRVLTKLGRHTNAEGWCRLNQGLMAKTFGRSRQAVNVSISRLCNHGYVEKRQQYRTNGANSICEYRVSLDRDEPSAACETHPPCQLETTGACHPGMTALT